MSDKQLKAIMIAILFEHAECTHQAEALADSIIDYLEEDQDCKGCSCLG